MRLPWPVGLVVPLSLACTALWLTAAVAQAQSLPGVPSAAKAAVAPATSASKPVVNTVAPLAQHATAPVTTVASHVAPSAAPPSSPKSQEQQKTAPPPKPAAAPEPATRAAAGETAPVAPVAKVVQPRIEQLVAVVAPQVDQVTEEAVEPLVASVVPKAPSVEPLIEAVDTVVELEPVVVVKAVAPPLPLISAPVAVAPVIDQAPPDVASTNPEPVAATADTPEDLSATSDSDEPVAQEEPVAPASLASDVREVRANDKPAPVAADGPQESQAMDVAALVDDALVAPSELELTPTVAPIIYSDSALATTVASLEVGQVAASPAPLRTPALTLVSLGVQALGESLMTPEPPAQSPHQSEPGPAGTSPPSAAPASALVSGGGPPGTAVPIVISLTLAAAWRALWLVGRLLPVGITLPSLAPPG